jgi:hypothetical protein
MVTEIVPADERVSADELEPTVQVESKQHQLATIKELSAEIATESDLIQWINDEFDIITTLTESVTERKVRLGQVLAKVQNEMRYKRPGFQEWCEANVKESLRTVYYYIESVQELHTLDSVHEETPTYEEPEVVQPDTSDIERANNLHALITTLDNTSHEYKLELGNWLIAKKEEVGHGSWLNWVSENLIFEHDKATRYMNYALAQITQPAKFEPEKPEPKQDKAFEPQENPAKRYSAPRGQEAGRSDVTYNADFKRKLAKYQALHGIKREKDAILAAAGELFDQLFGDDE